MKITMAQAVRLYRAGNNGGAGYGSPEQTIGASAEATGRVILERASSGEVAVVVDADDDVIAIGGDAFGRQPRKVCIGSIRDGEFVANSSIDG